MRCYPEIEAKWRDVGITPQKQVAVYDGGWFEWSSDHKNPAERDAP